MSQTRGFNLNFTDFTVKAGIAKLDWDAQSFVQPSRIKRKILVPKKIHILPFKNPVPSSQRQLKMNCSNAAKI